MTRRAPSLVSQIARRLRRPLRLRLPAAPDRAGPLIVLAAIPLVSALAVEGQAQLGRWRNASLERTLAPKLAAHAAVARAAAVQEAALPLLTRPTIGAVAEHLAAVLPGTARVHLMAVDAKGRLRLEIDCPDPEALRAALAGDPLFETLRMTGQGVAASEGVRVILASPEP
ncbi:hypothetical protein PQ455_14755 [Sphingomonas naphthae]|uniref:GspL periplasmic domain-containing protein n=1 Tax=Sphingomonas naphthae TaxID=1813468 RepID=A0ABY7TIX5_9SPHN|nr:hypothetical protein [Sphingomonas naphthae]WCT72885.1 hypothetical protein PQ455_14755 [Sphingomonas naphthae]